jgi:hypothetical protein
MSNLFEDINSGKEMNESAGGNAAIEKMKLSVELYQAQTDKDKDGKEVEFIQIQFKNEDKEFINVRQYLNKREDGSYKAHIYPGNGKDILPSISAEILHNAKEYMREKYGKLREKCNGITRKFFENLELEMDVKRVKGADGREYLIPMFAWQVKKDADYAASRGGANTSSSANSATVDIDPDDLPF